MASPHDGGPARRPRRRPAKASGPVRRHAPTSPRPRGESQAKRGRYTCPGSVGNGYDGGHALSASLRRPPCLPSVGGFLRLLVCCVAVLHAVVSTRDSVSSVRLCAIGVGLRMARVALACAVLSRVEYGFSGRHRDKCRTPLIEAGQYIVAVALSKSLIVCSFGSVVGKWADLGYGTSIICAIFGLRNFRKMTRPVCGYPLRLTRTR